MAKLLMIPGPIEVAPEVIAAFSGPPPGHLSPPVIAAHGRALKNMRAVWRAGADAQPFIVPGSGTLAMEMAAVNLCQPGDRALVVNTGYFSDRAATMLRRRGAEVVEVKAPIGEAPGPAAIATALDHGRFKALFATHVDTSTGVRVDAESIARAARERGVLSVFDGVCATAAERFEMAAWGADVYLTASQKAIGVPPGLALLVASPRAMAAREALEAPPPMVTDWLEWRPIMAAYEAGAKAYFATPATNHILALDVSLESLVREGMDAVFARHEACAGRFRALWRELGLSMVPKSEELAANTLSAVRFPPGRSGPEVLAAVAEAGVVIAGGLHPEIKAEYFRVGHMGYSSSQEAHIEQSLAALRGALA